MLIVEDYVVINLTLKKGKNFLVAKLRTPKEYFYTTLDYFGFTKSKNFSGNG